MSTTTDNPEVSTTAPREPLRLSWYGQTIASLCWIASVFTYGIDGAGDLLQLMAASAWLVANIFTAVTTLKNR